jgi:hypothetical protein
MTDPPKPKRTPRFGNERRRQDEAEKRWREAGYPPEVVEVLRPDVRYSIVRVGDVEYAFSDHDKYVAALGAIWAAGLVPDHGPSSVPGSDLPDVALRLRGVDLDLAAQAWSDPEADS